jgi:lysyl-tRNA synthetase class I
VSIIKGKSAFIVRSSPTKYQEAIYFMARTVQDILTNAFFYHRLNDQMSSGEIKGVDFAQARFSSYAIFDSISVDISKLLEKKKNSWNFGQLFKEWTKYENDTDEENEVKAAISLLETTFRWLIDFRHDKVAHQSKKIEMTMLTALPQRIKNLKEVVETLDLFVDGEIPYRLHLLENGDDIDLRAGMGLSK